MLGTSLQLLTSSAAFRTEAKELRSTTRERVLTEGFVLVMASDISWSLEALRPARMRRDGDLEAVSRIKVAPRLLGVTPVVRIVLPLMMLAYSLTRSLVVVEAE